MNEKSCVGCRFLYSEGQGYSNYTWEDTEVRCAKDQNPNLPAPMGCDWTPQGDNWPKTNASRCELYAMPDFGRAPTLYTTPQPAQATQAEVTDADIEQVLALAHSYADAKLMRYGALGIKEPPDPSAAFIELRRAILSLRPEKVPMTDAEASDMIRETVRGATMCGREQDFDPDAMVQNAVYALCGPYARVSAENTQASVNLALAQQPATTEPVQTTPNFTQLMQILDGLNRCHSRDSKVEFLRSWIRDWTQHKVDKLTHPAPSVPGDDFDLICNAIDKADTITMEGDYMLDSDDCIAVVRVMQVLLSVRDAMIAAK